MSDIKFYTILSLSFILLTSSMSLQAQNQDFSAKQHRSMAYSALEYKDYKKAIHHFEAYLESQPDKHKERFQLAEAYRQYRDYEQALKHFTKLSETENKKFLLADFYRASLLQTLGKCEEAIPIFDQFRKDYRGHKEDRKYLRLAKNQLAACQGEMLQVAQEKTRIKAVGSGINGSHMEGSPLFLNEERLVYNSLKINANQEFDLEEDSLPQRQFYLAQEGTDANWIDQGLWDKNLQAEGYELANAAYNPDKSRLYFSACKTGLTGQLDCDLFLYDEASQKSEKLPKIINTKYRESQVAVGADDKGRDLIYFVSDRKEGKGGLDIWYSRYDSQKKKFKTPRNSGSKINSSGDEMTPFVNPRNRKLYFSSDGHPGYGQLDVFVASGERSKWTEPQNLGEMINSGADELYFTESPSGVEGVFASNRGKSKAVKNSNCCDDLYFYQYLDKILVPLKGKVGNSEVARELLENANIKIYAINSSDGELILEQSVQTNQSGEFESILEPNASYRVTVQKNGFFRKDFEIRTGNKNESLEKYIELQPMGNESIILENIYYKFDRSELTEEAKITIDTTLLPIMENNPEIIIELGSHTDGKGTKGYNLKLSQARAESVVKYLKSKGIDKKRLKAKGYGMAKPIAENKNADGSDNPEGRAKNRRTEFRIIGSLENQEEDDWD